MTESFRRGFTLVEIMIVTLIIGVLASVLYVGVIPYMKRSRDTKRTTSLYQYTSVLEAYEKNFDTFPSNYGSGGSYTDIGFCLSELSMRGNVLLLGNEGRFGMFNNNISAAPNDPDDSRLVPGCAIPGSYLYSRINYGNGNQIAILGASLEIKASANYGTGSDLIDETRYQQIMDAKKSSVPASSPDQLFIVSKLR